MCIRDRYWGEQPGTSGPVYVGAFVMFLFILGLFIVKGPMMNQCDDHADNNIGIISLQEKEIAAFVIKGNLLSVMDLVCIYYNITVLSLIHICRSWLTVWYRTGECGLQLLLL